MCLNNQSKAAAHTLALTQTRKHQDFAALLFEEVARVWNASNSKAIGRSGGRTCTAGPAEVSLRDVITNYTVSLQGAALPLKAGKKAFIVWDEFFRTDIKDMTEFKRRA